MEYLWVRFTKLLIRENIMNNNRIQRNQFMICKCKIYIIN
jgi:hypothetical protein